jgi:hypothetical protein
MNGTEVLDGVELDELLPFRIAAEIVPALKSGRNGATHVHQATLFRWATVGCNVIRLRYVKLGSVRCTSRRWLSEFFTTLTERADEGNGVPIATPATKRPARRRHLESIDSELDRLGV